MKLKILWLSALMALGIQEANALYVDAQTGYSYDWIYDPDGNGIGQSYSQQYINQYKIFIRPDTSGVHYYATQWNNTLGDADSLSLIGIYTNALLSTYLDESSVALNQSNGVSFVYDPAGDDSLPQPVSVQFGTEEICVINPNNGKCTGGQPTLGLNLKDEYADLSFSYISGKTMNDFLTSGMFSAEHYIYVHLQGLDTALSPEGSEKWKLTWSKLDNPCLDGGYKELHKDECGGSGGGGGGGNVPEPSIVALLGIGLLGMGMSKIRNRQI